YFPHHVGCVGRPWFLAKCGLGWATGYVVYVSSRGVALIPAGLDCQFDEVPEVELSPRHLW
ncbi:hypothetical protein HAX54_047291, partial [Datura stramonium]|nr:hypothetical protein [Datura stramonium]